MQKYLGEMKCGKFLLDGVCESNKTIYEFHGCFYHGCLLCYTETTFNTCKQMFQHSVNLRHKDRINFIKKNMPNYRLVEIWEHEWDEMVKNNLELKTFLSHNDIVSPLNPREALFGGRTNALKLYHKCNQEINEQICYNDYTSLYPFIEKYGKFPIGHPQILTENLDYSKNKYFGIIKCKILPPRKLYIPVLPARINNKLIFTLCYTCAYETNHTGICTHNDNQRTIFGTWVSLEVDKALELGYQIVKLYEVWHWNICEQYNKNTKQGGIFTSYINKALKEKQEASGFPSNCNSMENKFEYIKDYYENEGIQLDINNITNNKGKRAVAKLKANSHWGYYAMNTNKVQYKVITSPSEWQNMLSNKQYIIHDVKFVKYDTNNLSNKNIITK